MESLETMDEAYEVPTLVEVGGYADLTRGNPFGEEDDGGFPPFEHYGF